ncbi:MAG: cation:proton antiporter subunit C [Rickettsiaceae bacterium]|nr:cation:proton antiporter subunit C [Rickettsiaceae bacterium]
MSHFVYIAATIILSLGFYVILSSRDYVRKIIGLAIFQNSILIFYIALGKLQFGIAPVDISKESVYSSPIPHVLMLTAIVVGFSTLCVALALVRRIKKEFGTTDSAKIWKKISEDRME